VQGIGNIRILSADHSNPHNQFPIVAIVHTKPVNSKLRPKIGCHASLDPHLTQDSLDPSEPTTQTASRSDQPFLQIWPQSVRVLYNWMPLFPLKIAPSNTWFLAPTRVLNLNGISIGSTILQGSRL